MKGFVMSFYKPLNKREPSTQYRDRLQTILTVGDRVEKTPQKMPALTCFGTLSPMVFNVENGAPLIPDRKIGFWRKPIGELLAFINGVRDLDVLETEYGCNFWKDYRGKGVKYGLEPNDMGPASYGGVFHDFPTPEGGFNQFAHLIEQMTRYPHLRTFVISPWYPAGIGRGGRQKAMVTPCHGWLHFRIINGGLHMRMDQRSADMPIGVPSNMIQYFALLLMVAQVTNLRPVRYVHSFSDAHIYENQIEKVRELCDREPKQFPTLVVDPGIKNLFDFRPHHFDIEDYNPHPPMNIPYIA